MMNVMGTWIGTENFNEMMTFNETGDAVNGTNATVPANVSS